MIRFATEKDRENIQRISNMYSKDLLMGTLTDEQMTGIIDICLSTGVILLAEREGKVVGILAGRFVEGFNMGKFFEEVVWFVDPNYRGLGIMLFKRLLQTCEENDCKGVAMTAYCNEHFEGVDKLYKRSGFREIETKYYKTL